MTKTPDDTRKVAKEGKAKIVDLKFTDLLGVWQHFSIPIEGLNDELFAEGIGFDGSSIRGFQSIHESDMLLVADPETACLDPVLDVPTLNLIATCWIPLRVNATVVTHAISLKRQRTI
jgi:glutamine synthetase